MPAMEVACGLDFTVVVMEQGDLWSFSKSAYGQLGLGTDTDQLLLACVGRADEVFDGEAVVMVAAGYSHTLVLTAMGLIVLRRVELRRGRLRQTGPW